MSFLNIIIMKIEVVVAQSRETLRSGGYYIKWMLMLIKQQKSNQNYKM